MSVLEIWKKDLWLDFGIAIGNILGIADCHNCRLHFLDNEVEISCLPAKYPHGMTLGPERDIWILESNLQEDEYHLCRYDSLWNLKTTSPIIDGHPTFIFSFPNDDIAVLGWESKELRIYHPETLDLVWSLPIHEVTQPNGLVLLPDDNVIIVGAGDTKLSVYNLLEGKFVRYLGEGLSLPWSIALIDKQRIAVAERLGNKVSIWSLDGSLLQVLNANMPVGVTVLENKLVILEHQLIRMVKI